MSAVMQSRSRQSNRRSDTAIGITGNPINCYKDIRSAQSALRREEGNVKNDPLTLSQKTAYVVVGAFLLVVATIAALA